MKIIAKIIGFIILLTVAYSFSGGTDVKKESVYKVARLKKTMKIDANWNKPQWRSVKSVELTNYMGAIPRFRPTVHAKMMYDANNLYVIFRVDDRYVRSIIKDYNGPVSTEPCVEFFFSPDASIPDGYFNLEVNAIGTPLMAYHIFSAKGLQKIYSRRLKKVRNCTFPAWSSGSGNN